MAESRALKADNQELEKTNETCTEIINLQNKQITGLYEVIDIKEGQIRKMENTPQPVRIEKQGWNFLEITGAILGSFVLGYSIGKYLVK